MPEVLGFWRMAGEYDYLMRVQVADMKRYDEFYKRLVNSVPGLSGRHFQLRDGTD